MLRAVSSGKKKTGIRQKGDELMKIVARTDVGLLRDNNQDAYAAFEISNKSIPLSRCNVKKNARF